MNIEKGMAQLQERLAKAREDLRIVEEQILFQMDVVEETKTRMLVSETPLAEREHHVARDDHERMLKEQQRIWEVIADIQREQDRLLDRLQA